MEDITNTIRQNILNNQDIMKYVDEKNVKIFYHPNARDIQDVVIVIEPLDTPKAADFGDNDNLTYQYFYQLDVFVKQKRGVNGRALSEWLVFLLQRMMWEELGFGETSSIKPEFNEEFNLYQQSKRFEGKQYYKI